MARNVDQVLRQQLGNLLLEIAVLTSQNEALTEELNQLKAERAAQAEAAKPEKLLKEPKA